MLVGMGTADDAAVYRLNRTTAVVSTVDFFAPLVDDPETYGAIAAANAMSDVYAMGGEVIFALNVAAFPETLPAEAVSAILRGGAEKVREAGGVVAGGHTIWDDEPKYGLAVTGLAHPARLFRKSRLKPGDALYLTKPLGTGALLSAWKNGHVDNPDWLDAAVASMTALNRHAAHLCHEAGVVAATDVTGFGLLGHLWEMCERSALQAEVDVAYLPPLPGIRESFEAGVHTGGESRNRSWLAPHVTDTVGNEILASIAYDPQTSGGLLIGAQRNKARRLEAAFERDGVPLWRIGRVREGTPHIRLV
jgi:selenide,water dikinase